MCMYLCVCVCVTVYVYMCVCEHLYELAHPKITWSTRLTGRLLFITNHLQELAVIQ